ncbi:MAG: amino acid decarboxylase [Oscillospiraceae bacterium]|nr:amino acid decarboxylase [Oscillospiraceae bacterium]
MQTPVYDFARKYADSGAVRMHMPGHKGKALLGCEPLDLTEIAGADSLFEASGILAQSEANAGSLFGCRTLYSAEGSSLCIRAMLYLALLHAADTGRPPVIAAARNVHKAFLTAAKLLGFTIRLLPQQRGMSYLSGALTDAALESCLSGENPPAALYLTSPDYLGNLCDIRKAAEFCRAHDMLLLVDQAHGAYLHFLPQTLHAADLGADLCCDSAHKTLPVLTGGAYLHIADSAPEICKSRAKEAMALFASTSPSYLILESLDLCNRYLSAGYPERLRAFLERVQAMRAALSASGWALCGDEPMKLTLRPKPRGYHGQQLAELMQQAGIFCEFADPDHLVLMLTPENPERDLCRVQEFLCKLPQLAPLPEADLPALSPAPELRPRELLFANTETLPVSECIGRICAGLTLSCPPAVPIVLCGERITEKAVQHMTYYGITHCTVVK